MENNLFGGGGNLDGRAGDGLDCDLRVAEAVEGLRCRVTDGHRLLVVCGLLHVEYNVPPVFGMLE